MRVFVGMLVVLCLVQVIQARRNTRGWIETISTPNKYHYIQSKHDFSTHPYVVFDVKACNDAHVSLWSRDQLTHEIVIGGWGNTASVIRKVHQGKAVARAPGRVLDCGNFRRFWISFGGFAWWKNIQIGTPTRSLMFYHDPQGPRVTNIRVSTGWGATGVWKIYRPPYGTMAPKPKKTVARELEDEMEDTEELMAREEQEDDMPEEESVAQLDTLLSNLDN